MLAVFALGSSGFKTNSLPEPSDCNRIARNAVIMFAHWNEGVHPSDSENEWLYIEMHGAIYEDCLDG